MVTAFICITDLFWALVHTGCGGFTVKVFPEHPSSQITPKSPIVLADKATPQLVQLLYGP